MDAAAGRDYGDAFASLLFVSFWFGGAFNGGADQDRLRPDPGRAPRPWTTFGYDELNWTYTPRGKRALRAFGAFAERPYFVRAHNLLTSGRGFSWPHWGSGNVYHEDSAGNPAYDWTTVDLVFDAYREVGFKPLVELGFTPRALVPPDTELPFTRSPSLYAPYEAYEWSLPAGRPALGGADVPAGPALRRALRPGRGAQLVLGAVERAGHRLLAGHGGAVLRPLRPHRGRALPGPGEIKVGGPAVTGGERATRFMDAFLAHCAGEGEGATNAVSGEWGPAWTSSPSTPKAPPSAGATTPSRTTGPSSPGAGTARGRGGWRCHGCHPRGRRC